MPADPPSAEPDARVRAAAAANGPADFIVVDDLHKSLGGQHVLRGASLSVRRGETIVIIGASGGGKSVFLKHLIGLMRPDRGVVRVDGVDIAPLRERQLGSVRRKLGVLFQNGALFDFMNVAQNVAFPLREAGVRNEREIEERVREALRFMDMEKDMDKAPIDLSGGMRKRVALARAVVGNPQCILYDEPTTGLDPVTADSINYLIRRLQEKYQITSIVVTHDMKSAYHVGDRMAYLVDGKIYFTGTPEDFQNATDPVIVDFVKGRSHAGEGPAVP